MSNSPHRDLEDEYGAGYPGRWIPPLDSIVPFSSYGIELNMSEDFGEEPTTRECNRTREASKPGTRGVH